MLTLFMAVFLDILQNCYNQANGKMYKTILPEDDNSRIGYTRYRSA